MYSKLYRIANFSLCLFSLVCLINGFFFSTAIPPLNYLAFSLLPFLLALFKPDWTMAIILFCLPIFGNKPGTQQEIVLFLICLSVQVALTIRLKDFRPNLTGFGLILYYGLVSSLSLIPVSLLSAVSWLKSVQTSILDFTLSGFNLTSLIFGAEDHPAYPVKSVILTLLAISFCCTLSVQASRESGTRKLYAVSILYGLLFSLLIGLLDYYKVISLSAFRGLDPVVNPDGTQYRLQSWFGHSGWFAEYITLAAPFVMLILLLKLKYWVRVATIIFCLLIGEFVLILTFQRGGWLSYPLTLLAIWSAIYIFSKSERDAENPLSALKHSFGKVLISAPLTIMISILALKIFGSHFGLDQYASRFKDITKTSDRIEFLIAGLELGSLNPVLGQGSESFALQYKREYLEQDGKYQGSINLPLHGTAHSLYAQTFAGKGALGLVILLLLMATAIRRGLSLSFSSGTVNSSDRVVALACTCSVIACLIYGFVQELFYVQSLQYLFFSVLGLLFSIPAPKVSKSLESEVRLVILLTMLALLMHIWLFNQNRRAYSDSYGCYPTETDSSGSSWRWCGVRSSIDFKKSEIYGKKMLLEFAPAMSESSSSQLLEIRQCGQILFSQNLRAGEKATLDFSELKIRQCDDTIDGFVRLSASSGHYFIPALHSSESRDRRVLSFRWFL